MPNRVRAAIVSLSALLAGGCSLLVDGELDPMDCVEASDDGDACPSDMYCLNARCASCEDSERCGNGVDDNCDGTVDEDCSVNGGGSTSEAVGCDDEPCAEDGGRCASLGDGLEPECLQTCCSSEHCPARTVCRAVEPADYRLLCVSTDRLNEVGTSASDTGALAVGEYCSVDSDCRSALCSSEGVCSDVCCDASDCGALTECAPSGPGWSGECF